MVKPLWKGFELGEVIDPSSCTLRQADLCTLARATWWRPCLKKAHPSKNIQCCTARVTVHIWRAWLLCSQCASNINNHFTYVFGLITLSDIHHHTILSAEASSWGLANVCCSSAFLTPLNKWLFKRQEGNRLKKKKPKANVGSICSRTSQVEMVKVDLRSHRRMLCRVQKGWKV